MVFSKVSFCPNNEHVLATYTKESENIILWDLRRYNRVERLSCIKSSKTRELHWQPNQQDSKLFLSFVKMPTQKVRVSNWRKSTPSIEVGHNY